MSNNLHTDSCNGKGCCFCRPRGPRDFDLAIRVRYTDPKITPAILAHALKQALSEAEIEVIELSCKEVK